MSKNDELREVARPLVDYIRKNYHPHTTVIVDCNHAEVLEGVAVAKYDEQEEEMQAKYCGDCKSMETRVNHSTYAVLFACGKTGREVKPEDPCHTHSRTIQGR